MSLGRICRTKSLLYYRNGELYIPSLAFYLGTERREGGLGTPEQGPGCPIYIWSQLSVFSPEATKCQLFPQ